MEAIRLRPGTAPQRRIARGPEREGTVNPQDFSARTTYRRPAAWHRRRTGLGALLTFLGLAPRDAVTLEVRGRASGELRRVPILRTRYQGEDYLVALAGESQWTGTSGRPAGRRSSDAAAGVTCISPSSPRRTAPTSSPSTCTPRGGGAEPPPTPPRCVSTSASTPMRPSMTSGPSSTLPGLPRPVRGPGSPPRPTGAQQRKDPRDDDHARPLADVSDFVADERNEPKYNPRMTAVEKLTPGPITTGTGGRPPSRRRGGHLRPTSKSPTTPAPCAWGPPPACRRADHRNSEL